MFFRSGGWHCAGGQDGDGESCYSDEDGVVELCTDLSSFLNAFVFAVTRGRTFIATAPRRL